MSAQMSETMPLVRDAAWYADPSGAHEHRYWNGQDWTDFVSDQGVQANDPLPSPPTSGADQGIEVASAPETADAADEKPAAVEAPEPFTGDPVVADGAAEDESAVAASTEAVEAVEAVEPEPKPKRRSWRRPTPAPLPPVEVPDGGSFACHHRSNGSDQIVVVWSDRVERRSTDGDKVLAFVPGSRIASVEQRVLGTRSIVQVNTYGPTVEFRVAAADGDDLLKAIGEIALATDPAVARVP